MYATFFHLFSLPYGSIGSQQNETECQKHPVFLLGGGGITVSTARSRPLGKDLSISELERMRVSGMTNRDIAGCLGVSATTIRNHIGKQPGGMQSMSAFMPKRESPASKEQIFVRM